MRGLIPVLSCAVLAGQSPAVIANADLAFARLASEKGTSAAFLANLADGSRILAPQPEDALTHYAKDKDAGALHWWPTWVGISSSGDLAYSTGCWEYRAAKDKPRLASGHFLTVWAKQKDFSWKVAFDCGVPSSIRDPADTPDWNSFLPPAPPPSGDGPSDLMEADRRLSNGDSILQSLAFGATVYRRKMMPLNSRAALLDILGKELPRAFKPQGAVASQAQDLGYSWGVAAAKDGSQVSYLHLWVRPSGAWQILYDLELPMPKP